MRTLLSSTAANALETSSSPLPGSVVVTLENGLQLILCEDHSAPVVSVQAWCRAGSVDEGSWLGAGLSHVLEHMLFKGTHSRAPGRIDQEVQAAGGYINAYTSFDRTVYWINVPNSGTSTAVDIVCDIFQNATLPADELVKELDVIRREMDMGHDDPGRRSSRRLFETVYTRSPYRYPIIGILDIFNRLTRTQIAAYYDEKYAPNNCFLVVVGDFVTDEIVTQVRQAFGGTTGRPVPQAPLVPEPAQTSPREVVEEAPIELAHFHLAWPIPDLRHPDTPALDVLSTLLGSGRSSRLYQAVRERAGLVHSIHGWIYTPGQTGMFGVSGIADGSKFPAARNATLSEIERMKAGSVSTDELAKAVKQFTAATLATRKTMEGQAQDLGGSWLMTADLSFSGQYLESVRQVTVEAVQGVAQKYLTETQRNVYALLPRGSVTQPVRLNSSRAEHPIQRIVLSNGLRVLLKEDHRLPFVDFRMTLNGGLPWETPHQNGITQLAARMWVKGTQRRSAEAIASAIENVGGHLEPYGGNHSFGLTAEVMREDLELGLDLLADIITNPAWPPESLEREREVQRANLKGQRDQLLQSAFVAMRRELFGSQGYGLDLLGTDASITQFSRDDLTNFHGRLVRPNNGVLAVFGDFAADALAAHLELLLQRWSPAEVPGMSSPTPLPGPRTGRIVESREKEQAVVVLGFPGTTFTHPDRFALELIQEACSDMGTRLFLRIRDELGLAYYVGATNFVGRTPGFFAFYCGTAPEKADLVEAELRQQADALRREGLTAEELARAKAKVVGQKKIARQDLGHVAMTSALDELYGLGFANFETEDARYEAVTLEEIRSAAVCYLRPEDCVVTIVRGA